MESKGFKNVFMNI